MLSNLYDVVFHNKVNKSHCTYVLWYILDKIKHISYVRFQSFLITMIYNQYDVVYNNKVSN